MVENFALMAVEIEEEKVQPKPQPTSLIIEEVIPVGRVRVLERVPTKAEFYGGLYLKPFVVKDYLKKEDVLDIFKVQDLLSRFPLKGTWRF
jgi:hypothetical protein